MLFIILDNVRVPLHLLKHTAIKVCSLTRKNMSVSVRFTSPFCSFLSSISIVLESLLASPLAVTSTNHGIWLKAKPTIINQFWAKPVRTPKHNKPHQLLPCIRLFTPWYTLLLSHKYREVEGNETCNI